MIVKKYFKLYLYIVRKYTVYIITYYSDVFIYKKPPDF